MTGFPDEMAAHLRQTVTTLSHCWRLTRKDGTVLGFTDHDHPLTCDGTTFRPETGLTASEARSTLDLAVDTVDVEGALSSLDIAEEDIFAGVYDGARIETLLVNWRQPSVFAPLRQAVLGKIVRRDGAFVAELESLASSLDQANGRTVARRCDAALGDGRCGIDAGRPEFSGAGVVVSMEGYDTLVVAGLEAFADGWFSNGVLTWSSGANAGHAERVVSHRVGGDAARLVLWSDDQGAVQVGDGFAIVAGCDKRFETCQAKFANSVNFRGFPHLPGNDTAYAYVNEDGDFDGGPVVP